MTLINMLRPKHRQWLRRLRKRLANREHRVAVHKLYLAGGPALLVLGRPSTRAHWWKRQDEETP